LSDHLHLALSKPLGLLEQRLGYIALVDLFLEFLGDDSRVSHGLLFQLESLFGNHLSVSIDQLNELMGILPVVLVF